MPILGPAVTPGPQSVGLWLEPDGLRILMPDASVPWEELTYANVVVVKALMAILSEPDVPITLHDAMRGVCVNEMGLPPEMAERMADCFCAMGGPR